MLQNWTLDWTLLHMRQGVKVSRRGMEPFAKGMVEETVPVVRIRTWRRRDEEKHSQNQVFWFVHVGEATVGFSQPKLRRQRGGRTTNTSVCRNTHRREYHIRARHPRERFGSHWEKVRLQTKRSACVS